MRDYDKIISLYFENVEKCDNITRFGEFYNYRFVASGVTDRMASKMTNQQVLDFLKGPRSINFFHQGVFGDFLFEFDDPDLHLKIPFKEVYETLFPPRVPDDDF